MFKKKDTVIVLPTCHEKSMIGKILTVTSSEIKLTYSGEIVVFTMPKKQKRKRMCIFYQRFNIVSIKKYAII